MNEELMKRLEKEREMRIKAEKRNRELERVNTALKAQLLRTVSDREYICA